MATLSMAAEELRDPASQVTRAVERLLADLHGRSRSVTLDDDLERNLGLGSLERAELVVRLENAFSLTLGSNTLVEARTAGDLLASVLAARGGGRTAGGGTPAPAAAPIDRSPAWRVPDAGEVKTLAEVARYRAETDGEKSHVFFLAEDGEEQTLTYAGLWQRALQIAEGLASRGLEPGGRVALVLPTGEDFFPAFLGIQCAGLVPVPIYPPIRLDQLGAYLDRHATVLADAGAALVLSDERLRGVSKLLRDRVPGLSQALTVRALESDSGLGSAGLGNAEARPGDLGLIQYTSGSTGRPKGVALSHHNLLANMRAIGKGLGLGPEDVAVSWVPLYHDMGLVGCWMTALLYATPVVMMSPLAFLSRPERWLWAIDRHRGTVAPSPNFGYELCSRRISDAAIEGLDLSRWRLAINGAEAVLPSTIDHFCDRFRPYGFQPRAMFPVYGLAETCLGLTVPPRGRGPRYDVVGSDRLRRERRAVPAAAGEAATTCVSVGSPLDTQKVRIVDVDDPAEEVPERTEGRILMRGPSVMAGYFRQGEATAAVRVGEWTDTGDLGYLAGGEVFITGRIKDVVIYAGRNYHPHDLEQAAATVPGIRKGCVIAFDAPAESVTSDAAGAGEAIVVVAETREPKARFAELEERVEAAVLEATGAPVDSVVLVPPGTVLKTSSGKLRRRETRDLYLAGPLRRASESRWVLAGIVLRSLLARARSAAARALGGLYSLYAGAVFAVLTLFAMLWIGFLSRRRDSAWRLGRRSLRWIFALSSIPVRRRGPALPAGPAIIVTNHGSYLDGLFLTAALERPLSFTAKKDIFSWPLAGRTLKRLGCVSIDRSDGAAFVDSYAKATAAADAGDLLHFFPEGTFTRAAGVRPFRLGAFQLAAEKGLPVVPVALRGARAVLPDKSLRLRRATVEVEVLPVLEPTAEADLRAVAGLRNRAREVLARASGEPLLDISSAALPGA